MNLDHKSSLSDIPFSEEVNDFGTERYVNGLIKFIENSSAPITIALQGEWGSGKTSLMTRLENELCSEGKPFVGIDINTWEYSMLSTPEETVVKIIERLVNELSHKTAEPRIKFNKFMNYAKRALYRGGREAMKMVPGLNVAVEMLNMKTDLNDKPEPVQEVTLADLKDSLESAVKTTIDESNKQGIIVFVDDLDRLNPPVAVEILELLKNIFCLKNCIFVLAIDYEVVVKGLEPKFGKLNDKNEREFRSFFDKIIQVPFSLPVSSYRPMDFVHSALEKIGYITAVEKGDERFRRPFKEIVEGSVGKNPRSIKRLINTLSLLSCISSCGEDKDAEFLESREGRIVNFAIVSIQVCYPKIYKMLAIMPNFKNWDEQLTSKLNIHLQTNEDDAPDWEEVLEAACSADNYLAQHHNDIRKLLLLIQDTLDEDDTLDNSQFEEKIRSVIDKSSITGVSEPMVRSDVNQKRLIDTLHHMVSRKIKEKRPDILKVHTKRNTGNGGFYLFYKEKNPFEVILRPNTNGNAIACEIRLLTNVRTPERLAGKPYEEIKNDSKVKAMLESMDRCVSPLLKDAYYFTGSAYQEEGPGTYFKSFTEEQEFRHSRGWDKPLITTNVSYWITLNDENLFSDKAIIETIADVIIAGYDLKKEAEDI